MTTLLLHPTNRLASSSPLGFAAGDANLYRFVANNSTNLTDPSGRSPVGHHWIPVSLLTNPIIRALLGEEAFELALGSYSGKTAPDHCPGPYGGVSHNRYTEIVNDEMLDYMKANKIKKMNFEQMEDFISKIEKGLDHKGKPHSELQRFNEAIRAERKAYLRGGRNRGFTIEQTPAQRRKQGQSYLKNPRLMLGAILASLLSGAISEAQGAMNVAANSAHFRRAMKALTEGNLSGAEEALFGPGEMKYSRCFYQELVDNKLEKAAAVFEEYYRRALQDAQNRVK